MLQKLALLSPAASVGDYSPTNTEPEEKRGGQVRPFSNYSTPTIIPCGAHLPSVQRELDTFALLGMHLHLKDLLDKFNVG